MGKPLKYRINDLLSQLPKKDYDQAIQLLPIQLKVSVATFNNWRKIGLDDMQDIPHEKVAMLEKLFDIEPGELQNFTLPTCSINELLHSTTAPTSPRIAGKHGLLKS